MRLLGDRHLFSMRLISRLNLVLNAFLSYLCTHQTKLSANNKRPRYSLLFILFLWVQQRLHLRFFFRRLLLQHFRLLFSQHRCYQSTRKQGRFEIFSCFLSTFAGDVPDSSGFFLAISRFLSSAVTVFRPEQSCNMQKLLF